MQYLEFILLGILQGITEFLPISSSGHLLIGRKLFGINEYGLLIEVFLHLGTLFSIILFWYKDIVKEYKLVINGKRQFLYSIIIATIPASLVGVLFNDYIKDNFFNIESMRYLAFNYLLLSFIILLSKFITNNKSNLVKYKYAFLIGIAQSIAILPGFSRSGLTIVVAMYLGLSFKTATKFSFLLAIPILVFASFDSIYQYFNLSNINNQFNILLLLGLITAFITGYFILGLLQKIIENRKFWYFSIYSFLISLILFYGI